MADTDTVEVLKGLIADEVRKEKPSFLLIPDLVSALRTAMASAGEASIFSHGSVAIAGNEQRYDENFQLAQPLTVNGRNPQADEHLVALDQITRRSGPDPLLAAIQAVPVLGEIYGADVEARRGQRAYLSVLRAQLEERLGLADKEDEEEEAAE